MEHEKLWTTLWKTIEDRPESVFRHALNRMMPQALAETRAASPSARISGFSGVKHRTYSAFALASMRPHAQTRQQLVDSLWISPQRLWRKGALKAAEAVDERGSMRGEPPPGREIEDARGCGRSQRGPVNQNTQEIHKV
ncbi:hypothetical protein [Brevibacterium renqingii]|uniref:hypothetical protein n=1 Tax=Brevibacterium renqingii TaxID=2776916 RepID=UPI001AE05D33|nr:hypothetical protein [Brevibacterium renqingii]